MEEEEEEEEKEEEYCRRQEEEEEKDESVHCRKGKYKERQLKEGKVQLCHLKI